MKPEIGLHRKVEDSIYASWDAANFSTAKHMRRSPAHCYEVRTHPPDSTPAMALGSAIHCAVLEPDLFPKRYVQGIKVDRRTKVGKAEWAAFEVENADKLILKNEDWHLCLALRDAAWRSPLVAALLKGSGENELSLAWEDEETGVLCKGRVDRFTKHDGWTWVLDLKSAEDASPNGFSRSVANYDYHIQGAMYLDGLATLSPADRRFAWIAIEKKPPYGVAVYEASHDALELGRFWYRRWLAQWAECEADDTWPAYPNEISLLDVPTWAHRQAEKEDPIGEW